MRSVNADLKDGRFASATPIGLPCGFMEGVGGQPRNDSIKASASGYCSSGENLFNNGYVARVVYFHDGVTLLVEHQHLNGDACVEEP
jgi:hypothetical protein